MHEMTASDMLRDPLIRQMLRADKISIAQFATMLDAATRRQARLAGEAGSARPVTADVWTASGAIG